MERTDLAIFQYIKGHNSRMVKVKPLVFTWSVFCRKVLYNLVEAKLKLENGNDNFSNFSTCKGP